ncbi:CYTH domain-containing protein [Salipaludibacillus daqingensis]|uniref:CYTH domain-containing protein n=1 Tax=Salipaludibacillus daqingensis TaxID=3041001 RepID=UPI0024769366|nr:CYTH domain-containing protein [Salipaludibacillus daqingensis]
MSQEIEIEFKNLITKEQYEKLLTFFSSTCSPMFKQVNHYFDTESFSLKALKSALRVRYKQDGYVLTLKQPHVTGLLETHQKIDNQSFHLLKEQGKMESGDVSHQIKNLIGEPVPLLCYLGHLTTERTEVQLKEGLLVLDKSYYFDRVDYEIEFECKEAKQGKNDFQHLMDSWGLTWIEPANKIERFYNEKMRIAKE